MNRNIFKVFIITCDFLFLYDHWNPVLEQNHWLLSAVALRYTAAVACWMFVRKCIGVCHSLSLRNTQCRSLNPHTRQSVEVWAHQGLEAHMVMSLCDTSHLLSWWSKAPSLGTLYRSLFTWLTPQPHSKSSGCCQSPQRSKSVDLRAWALTPRHWSRGENIQEHRWV